MIIWGWKGRTSKAATGEFFCPECKNYESYTHKIVKNWFTLYFIPVIPLKVLGEYVECDTCKSTYKLDALEYDPRAEQQKAQAIFALATRDVMLKMAMADGSVDEEEILKIIGVFENVTKHEITREQIDQRIIELEAEPQDISSYASTVSGFLNETGKEMVLRGAIAIAKADGIIDEGELSALHRLSEALDLPRAYANGIFGEEDIPLKR